MVGLIIAVSILGALFVSVSAVMFYNLYKLNKTVSLMGECLVSYMAHPDNVEVIKQHKVSPSDFSFPNREGF